MAELHRAPTPRQLPHAVSDFTGRATERREVAKALSGLEGTLLPVVAVTGMGGVGKTTLAVRCAHDAVVGYPDGQLYADLAGAGEAPADSTHVLVSFLRALGQPDERIPHDQDGRIALYRLLTTERRLLVVLDNAYDAEQVSPLLPKSASCAALITSRADLAECPVTHRIPLTALPVEDAFDMLRRVSGRDGEEDAAALLRIATACGHLPLAVRVAGAQLAARPAWEPDQLARLLLDPSRRMEHLPAGDASLEAVFSLTYE